MEINPHIFREFSIRGIADQDLSNAAVTQIGRAVGTLFRSQNRRRLVVGRDVRVSSERISQALIAGLVDTGMNLIDVGMVPTPVLNFSTDHHGADGGIMITASHNPPDYNGLKIRAEQTLKSDDLQEILRLTRTGKFTSGDQGRVEQIDPLPTYLNHLRPFANWKNHRQKVVIDGGNGTNGRIVSSFLREMDLEVLELFCQPDGNFPNRNPDPTAPGATDALSESVLSSGANLGIAYDGDGDRLVAVDDQGKAILGDQLLMLFARDILKQGPSKIVYEILCTQALADDIKAHGGTPIMTPSGYAFIHQAMRETRAAVGGELSGHFFFNEPDFEFDDAILATIKLLNSIAMFASPMSASPMSASPISASSAPSPPFSLSQIVSQLPSYHSSPELRLPCPEEAKAMIVDQVKERYRRIYQIEEIDGARVHFPGGWALVRQSNTQPVLSMRFEALDAPRLEEIQAEVQFLVESLINEAGKASAD